MNHRKIITFYYIKKWVILSYVVMKYSGDMDIRLSGTSETPRNVADRMECGNVSVQAGAEIIINQQLS